MCRGTTLNLTVWSYQRSFFG